MDFSNEKTVETKRCPQCNISFNITDKDLEFYDKVSPTFGGEKYSIPTPILCPECRQQRRMSFRNERSLYKGTCCVSGDPIITFFKPSERKIMKREIYFSDAYNPTDYGKVPDFSRSFIEQLQELEKNVPRYGIQQQDPMENSEYCNCASSCKNCYLLFDSDYNEDSAYGNVLKHSKNCFDTFSVRNSENVYESIEIENGYSVLYSKNCKDCSESYYLEDCVNCTFCFGCKNLHNKTYCIFNKQYTKEKYSEVIKQLLEDKNIPHKVEQFFKTLPYKYAYNFLNENVSGNNISSSKNCYSCYDVNNIEDGKYTDLVYSAKNVYDVSSFGENISEMYECTSVGVNTQNVLFSSTIVVNSRDIMYSIMCFPNVQNCFLSVGLKDKQYCILNKQYTKEQYEELVPKIIEKMIADGEWGEFFPASMSPFGYNETVANEYFPLEKETAQKEGFNWSDYEAPFPKVEKIIPASKLPEKIQDIPDDILNWAIECEVTKKPFRIIVQELEFYRKHNLPIPKRHPDQRHLDRMKLRNPRKLFDRKCDKCDVVMKTTYHPDRPEKVYCQECYNKEVH